MPLRGSRWTPPPSSYRVQVLVPVPDGTEGGLFWGNTVVESGRVGSEYFIDARPYFTAREIVPSITRL